MTQSILHRFSISTHSRLCKIDWTRDATEWLNLKIVWRWLMAVDSYAERSQLNFAIECISSAVITRYGFAHASEMENGGKEGKWRKEEQINTSLVHMSKSIDEMTLLPISRIYSCDGSRVGRLRLVLRICIFILVEWTWTDVPRPRDFNWIGCTSTICDRIHAIAWKYVSNAAQRSLK